MNKIKEVNNTPELSLVPSLNQVDNNVVQMPVSIVLKPETVVTDVERDTETYALLSAIKGRFPNGKIEAPSLVNGMQEIKNNLFLSSWNDLRKFKLWLHSVNTSNELNDFDYSYITDYVNLHKGKYAAQWLYNLANINKLAMFVRSIRRIDRLNYYKNLSPEQWEICMDGIINKPESVINPLLRYKFDSTDINKHCSGIKSTKEAENDTKLIEKFLDTQKLKHKTQVYRGDKTYAWLNTVTINPFTQEKLGLIMEKFAQEIEDGKYSDEEIDNFINKNLISQRIHQNRFMSTAMDINSINSYAKKVLWKIDVPKGTKASMIESYNVERDSETEVLIQRNSRLKITDAYYDKANHRWELNAELLQ